MAKSCGLARRKEIGFSILERMRFTMGSDTVVRCQNSTTAKKIHKKRHEFV